MKIEKINENQIRCTLTRQDLEDHQIRLSELAYGTEKAKELFRDMIQQAQIQVGFEVDNIPLMIEAIPISTESIILIITKVEDPEELDTRFSKFAPFKNTNVSDLFQLDGADNILDLFQKIQEARGRVADKKSTEKKNESEPAAEEDGYQLVIHQDDLSPKDFNRLCNLLQEYSEGQPFSAAGEAFLKEHGDVVAENALTLLNQV